MSRWSDSLTPPAAPSCVLSWSLIRRNSDQMLMSAVKTIVLMKIKTITLKLKI